MTPPEFLCRRCGACCSGDGSVFLYPEDIAPLAAHLGLSPQQFADRHAEHIVLELRNEKNGFLYLPYLILKKNADGACSFLRDDRCSVHTAKPAQCRETPFVEEFFGDPAWQATLRKECPALAALTTIPDAGDFPGIGDREERYLALLREHRYNLGKLIGIDLPAPRIVICDDD